MARHRLYLNYRRVGKQCQIIKSEKLLNNISRKEKYP
nr:MAG TPA: hypothetical protein [Caudoviricetes sp.]